MTSRPPRPDPDAPRRTAYDVVLAVDVDGAYSNLLLPRLLRERRIEGRDAAFATELAYGTLRWQGVLDEIVAVGARRQIADIDAPVRAALRLGAYQLLHTRVPSHAAVHTSVQLVRAAAGERAVGFANAVLRRVGETAFDGWVGRLAAGDDIDAVAFRHGYPGWIAAALLEALDGDREELERALAEDRPITHLAARPGRIDRAELLAGLGPDAQPGPWSPYAVRLGGGDPAAIEAVRAGRAGVQDEGSQLVALAATRAALDGTDTAWLDMCAGPGGKAALLAGLVPPAGGRLVAADMQTHRARLVASTLAGAASALAVVSDGRRPGWRPGTFDRVLVDAPCTGLGALRRRPEVRWRREQAAVETLHRLQADLLRAAVDAVRPGGVVAYVTCSPHRAETRAVVAEIRAERADVEPLDARASVGDLPALGAGPDVQLWPHRHGTDAMYLALLRRGPA